MFDLVPSTWSVVLQTPDRALVLYNSSLRELRTVSPGDSSARGARPLWSSPAYFRLLAELMQRRGELPPALDSFLMNGYFDRFFPVREQIGRGGCGAVYRVEHSLAGIRLAEYAVKVIPVGEFAWLQKVISEVQLLEQLAQRPHPLILGYKHCWIEEWQPATFGPKIPCLFILMEYAPLGNLERMLSTDAPGVLRSDLVDEESWQLFLSIAVAVHHLHSLGIIHRDLKLSNVLLFEEKSNAPLPLRLVLSDFGTSVDAKTHCGGAARTGATGTIETMAPELLTQNEDGAFLFEHSFASDVWSLGVILFSLFYHRSPFAGEGGESALAHFTSLDALVSELGLGDVEVPELAKKLLQKMLRADPKDRCTLDEILRRPDVTNMLETFGLDACLRGDAQRVFVVSPSMEDIASSVPLPGEGAGLAECATQTDQQPKQGRGALMLLAAGVALAAAARGPMMRTLALLHVFMCIVWLAKRWGN